MDIAARTVGVRELKDNLSRHLAAVRQGREIVVTDHGHPIARLVPIHGKTSHERLAELMAAGEVTAARERRRSVLDPVVLANGATVTDLVEDQRR
jgi:prevent-host-death family protein